MASAGFRITPASLRQLCKQHKLYVSCPELNDVLYLQCKGITVIENLEAYTGLKTLYLEDNAIASVQGLQPLAELRCLYLGRNLIASLHGLEHLRQLRSLDLSSNQVLSLAGIGALADHLQTLNVADNRLQTAADVAELESCTRLESLDVSNNKLQEPEALQVLLALPLKLLKASGNPVVGVTKHYLKHVVAAMPRLNHLDDMPVSDKDRRLAAAFLQGGAEAERAERAALRREEDDLRAAHQSRFDQMVAAARAAPRAEPQDPMRFRAYPIGHSDDEDEAKGQRRPAPILEEKTCSGRSPTSAALHHSSSSSSSPGCGSANACMRQRMHAPAAATAASPAAPGPPAGTSADDGLPDARLAVCVSDAAGDGSAGGGAVQVAGGAGLCAQTPGVESSTSPRTSPRGDGQPPQPQPCHQAAQDAAPAPGQLPPTRAAAAGDGAGPLAAPSAAAHAAAAAATHGLPHKRLPWGGARYRSLWAMACELGARQEQQEEQQQQQQQPGEQAHPLAGAVQAPGEQQQQQQQQQPVQAVWQEPAGDSVDVSPQRDGTARHRTSGEQSHPAWQAAAAAEAAAARAAAAGPAAASDAVLASGRLLREWQEELQPLLGGRRSSDGSEQVGSSRSSSPRADLGLFQRHTSVGCGLGGQGSGAAGSDAGAAAVDGVSTFGDAEDGASVESSQKPFQQQQQQQQQQQEAHEAVGESACTAAHPVAWLPGCLAPSERACCVQDVCIDELD